MLIILNSHLAGGNMVEAFNNFKMFIPQLIKNIFQENQNDSQEAFFFNYFSLRNENYFQ